MTRPHALLCVLLFSPAAMPLCMASAQSGFVTIPAGTPLTLKLPRHLPMKAGESIRTELLYPVYVDNQPVLPAGTAVTGRVISLSPDRHRRTAARLRADFTPFHTPAVRFDSILPPSGPAIPISTTEATDGAPIYRSVRTPARKGGLAGQYFGFAMQHVKDTVHSVTGPDKGDRLLQFVYSQLPYHPERIAAATSWTVETSLRVRLEPIPEMSLTGAATTSLSHTAQAAAVPSGEVAALATSPTWTLQAYLDAPISSESSSTRQTIHATVAEPIRNLDGTIAVPQGSMLTGTITQARPAGHFARAGVLRFDFTGLTFPGGDQQSVRATMVGADTSSAAEIALDSEGQASPKPKDKIFVPILLVILASQPFDRGHDGQSEHMIGKDAQASSGMGLISLIVGTAAQQPNLAIGIGYYSAALSIYPRFFGKGVPVAFPKNTRIVIQTTANRSAPMKPDSTP